MRRTIAGSMMLAALAAGAMWAQVGSGVTVTCAPDALPEVVGATVSVACTASGGVAPYTWSISVGALPTGLTLDSNGNITGTLQAPGPYTFEVQAADSSQPAITGFELFEGNILGMSCLSALGPAEVNVQYTNTCTAAGGTPTYMWSISGPSVPPNLTILSSGGISYKPGPEAAGAYQYNVVVTDHTTPTPLSASQAFSGTIAPAVTIATPGTLPAAPVGGSYTQPFAVTPGTGVGPSFTWTASNLPNWLTMSLGGSLSGSPPSPGPVSFTVMVTDAAGGVSSGTFSLTVMQITPASPLPAATIGQSYNQTLTASGGTSPYQWAITSGSLPGGLSLSTAGAITGKPLSSAVTSTFTVTVTDKNNNSISASLTLPVNLVVTTASPLPAATIGTQYSQTLAAAGGAGGYSWSVATGTTLPSWLQLSPAGALTGLPPVTAVTSSISVTVTDSSSTTASATLTLPVTLTITTSSPLANGAVGVSYNQALTGTGGLPPYKWTVTAGSLPSGLSLNAVSGAISGQPNQAGTSLFSVQLSDSASPAQQTPAKQFSITIGAGLTITTPATLPNGTVNAAYSQTLSASGGAPPYTWSPAGPLPGALAALSLSAAGVISGTPTADGTGSFSVTVKDSAGSTSTQQFTLTILFVITTPSPLTSGEVTLPYKQTLAASGGASPYTWSVTGGALPPGLTLAASGLLSGTPSTANTYNFSVQATDSNNIAVSTALAVTIAPPLSISTPGTLAGGSVNSSYSQTLTASGGVGPYTWSALPGALPAGLNLSPAGVVSGIPTVAGTFPFTATVTDSLSATASRQFTIVVVAGLTVATPPTLPGATVGLPYSYSLQAAGGTAPYTWSDTSGLPPAGLSVKANGVVNGVPSVAATASFTVQVTDSQGHQASEQLSITVASPLSITTTSLPGATLGGAYSQSLAASGGMPPYTWSIATGALPPGLTLSAAGSITGTATTAGTSSFTILVTDSAGATATKQLSIVVSGGLSITTAATLPGAPLNASYSQTLAAAGGTPPYTWALTAGALPKGLTLSAAGALTGTPTASGTFQFTATVTDSASNAASQQFTLIVGGGLAIATTSLPGGSVGTSYNQTLTATGGTPPYTYAISAGSLPPGITLSGAVIGGTPTQSGSYTFTIQVTDSTSATATQQFTLVITGLAITTSSTLPGAAVGAAYSQTLVAAGGTPPYTWSGTPPAGLALSAAGVITGVPTAAGTVQFTVTVTDSASNTANRQFTLTVIPSPAGSFTGLSSSATSAQQLSGTLALSAAYPQNIAGQITLAFQPDSSLASPADDPSIQFSSGGRTLTFPALNNTTPVSFAIQTGTVAGTITLTVSWQAGNVTLAPLTQSITIAPAVPAISAATASATSSGFQVLVTAYSNTREVSQALLQFTPASGQTLQTTSLTVPLTTAANTWFQSSTSGQYGSQFVLTLPFNLTNGSASAIASVSVQLVNSQGTSTSASATP